jgi:hypothetical protein
MAPRVVVKVLARPGPPDVRDVPVRDTLLDLGVECGCFLFQEIVVVYRVAQ